MDLQIQNGFAWKTCVNGGFSAFESKQVELAEQKCVTKKNRQASDWIEWQPVSIPYWMQIPHTNVNEPGASISSDVLDNYDDDDYDTYDNILFFSFVGLCSISLSHG